MERLSTKDIRKIFDSLVDLYALRDRPAFARQAAATVSALVPCDFTNCFEFDVRRNQILSYEQYPEVRISNTTLQSALPYLGEEPLGQYFTKTGDLSSAMKHSDVTTAGRWKNTDLYNSLYRPSVLDATMALPLSFTTPWSCTIGLFRDPHRTDFTERDRLVLNILRPHLIQAFHNSQTITTFTEALAAQDRLFDQLDRGAIGTDRRGIIRWATTKGRRWLAQYFPTDRPAPDRLPKRLWDWVKQQKQAHGTPTEIPAPLAPLTITQGNARLQIQLVPEREVDLLLLHEDRPQCHRVTLAKHGLTPRECEVLEWVAQGKSNEAIATILGARPRTIQKHLERIYQKLGVDNRTAATAMMLSLNE
ncbi:MAG: LuxR C-terminal-related transcriptional regulator [Nitrospira sp.]|nr:LuxR C-terminal-related transcriptional regulator [Nitrospira sp.]